MHKTFHKGTNFAVAMQLQIVVKNMNKTAVQYNLQQCAQASQGPGSTHHIFQGVRFVRLAGI